MSRRIVALRESKPLRSVVATVVFFAALVEFSEMTVRDSVPVLIIFASTMVHEVADDVYDLPAGVNWIVYGAAVATAGGYLAFTSSPLLGALVALVGLWFVFDGVTTVQYGPPRTPHEYVTDLDGESGETMLRIQTLHVVYQSLRDATGPRTTAALATEVDLTESRVENALDYLAHQDRVERVGNRYRAIPPRWGRLTPVVHFFGWLPRRVGRPLRQMVADAP